MSLPWKDLAAGPSNWGAAVYALLAAPLFVPLGWWTFSYVQSPLKRYPGPSLAGWTNLWRFLAVRTGKYPSIIKKLHDKHGPVVRIGPNLIDLDYPELIKTIYCTDPKWRKTEFYHNNSAMINGQLVFNMFSTSDPAEHARMKRPVAKYFSLPSTLPLEPHMDKSLEELCEHLARRFTDGMDNGKPCDLGEWIAFCAWDLITSITFSHPYGYMENGCDFDNTLSNLDKVIDYFSAVGQMPFLDSILEKNPIVSIGPPNIAGVIGVALGSLGARLQGQDKGFDPEVPDLLHHFIETKTTHPDLVDDNTILGYMLIPLLAGADTTAIAIRAAFYFLFKNPIAYRKLQEEVLAAGFGTEKPAPYNEAKALPYLEAVVREAIRLHPSVSMPLERYVPAMGLKLPDGSLVPPGVGVGINPYIIGRNRKLWGEDADEFRPERWLQQPDESDVAFDERLRVMKAADLAFGSGSRICLGRNLALMEMYKMLATLISRFEIDLDRPDREWNVTGIWFARQTGLICNIRQRGAKAG